MLNPDQLKEDLKTILAKRRPERIKGNGTNYTHASVLLPLFVRDGQYWILFTKRTDTVEYHKGEVSFPGGVVDKDDPSLEGTAKRETFEEIGVREEDIEIMGQLDDMPTMSSRFIIHPFVGVVPFPYAFTINNREVENLIEVPLGFFLDPCQPQPFSINHEGQVVETSAFIYQGVVIWGATQRILENFTNLIRPTMRRS
ncbi:MAG: CoA pyrophosphatase [Deltaproteobacteria bacterium]|nr:MAG: CoA pyrophosphatase [Deltaproteobacteria bacterium]